MEHRSTEMELMFECPGVTKTPDYIYKGDRFDLKELNGASDKAIYNAIHKKKEQANNFIIDISKIDTRNWMILNHR